MPIVTAFAAIALGVVLSFVWPPIGDLINNFANWAHAAPTRRVAVFIYGFVERSLLPFGLHHIWNVPFFFDGLQHRRLATTATGILTRFFAGDPESGILGGGFLFKMFGLPGAALAIWQTAKPREPRAGRVIMISAALTSFLTGITEPIEFSFLFVAPLLYVVHALSSPGSPSRSCTCWAPGSGYTFSQGAIDYVLFFANGIKPWLVLIVGPDLLRRSTTSSSRALIKWLNLKTPGREDDESTAEEASRATSAGTSSPSNWCWPSAAGATSRTSTPASPGCGSASTTSRKADQKKLKALGAAGVLRGRQQHAGDLRHQVGEPQDRHGGVPEDRRGRGGAQRGGRRRGRL